MEGEAKSLALKQPTPGQRNGNDFFDFQLAVKPDFFQWYVDGQKYDDSHRKYFKLEFELETLIGSAECLGAPPGKNEVEIRLIFKRRTHEEDVSHVFRFSAEDKKPVPVKFISGFRVLEKTTSVYKVRAEFVGTPEISTVVLVDSQPCPDATVSKSTREIIITLRNVRYAGKVLTCQLKNPAGTDSIQETVEFASEEEEDLVSRQVFIDRPVRIVVIKKQTVHFSVTFRGYRPQIRWTIDGKDAETFRDVRTETNETVSLLIVPKNSRIVTSSIIKFTVENEYSLVKSVYTVVEKRPVLSKTFVSYIEKQRNPTEEAPEEVTKFTLKPVPSRKTVIITAKLKGKPYPDIKWIVFGQVVPANDKKFKVNEEKDGTVSFEVPESETEKGLPVEFIAENRLGSINYRFVLCPGQPKNLGKLEPEEKTLIFLADPKIEELLSSGTKPEDEEEPVDEDEDKPKEKRMIESAPSLKKPSEPEEDEEEIDEEMSIPQEKKQIESAPPLQKKQPLFDVELPVEESSKPEDYRKTRRDDTPREVPENAATIVHPIKPEDVDDNSVTFTVEFNGRNPKTTWTIDGKNVTLNKDAKIETKSNVSTLTLTNRKKYPKSEITFMVENDITKVQNAVTLTERPVILDVVLDKSVKKKSPLDEAPKVVTPFTVKKVRKTTVIEGKVTGRPTPDIKWLVNGQKVPQNDPKFKPTTKRDGTSTFEVPDEESEKGLEVTFIAENYLGKVDYSFVLSVDKPTTLDLNPIMEEFLLLCDPTISESMESAIVEPTDEKKPKEPSRKKPDEPSQKKPGQKPVEEDEEVDEESDQPQEKKQIESAPGLKKQPEEPAKKKPEEPKKTQPGKKPMDDEDEEVDEESDKPQEKKQIESAPSLRKKPDETKPIDYRTERVDDKPREIPQSGAVITSPIKPLVVDEDTVKFVVEFDGNNPKPSWTIDGKNVTLNKDAKIETKDNVSTLTLTNRKKYPKSELTFLVENDITKVQNAVTLTERPVILDVVLDKSVKKKSPLDEAPKVVTPFTVKKVRKTTVIEGKVTGRPTPDIKWLVNGQKVPQNDPKFKPTTKRDGTSTFEVPDEESEKGLEVTFIAENYLGKVDYSFVLSVDKPTTLDLNPIMEEFLLLCDPTISESVESAIVEPTDEKKPKEPSRKKPDEPSQKKPGQKPAEEDEEVDEESDQPQEKKQIESAPGLKKQPEEPAKKKPEEPKKTQPGKKPMDDEDEEVDEESDKPQEKKQIESAPSLRKKPDETKPIDYRTERVDDKPREVPQSGAVITSPIKPLVVDEDTVKFVVEFDGNNPKPSWTIDGKNVTLNKDAKIETKDNVSTLTLTNRKKYPKSELTFLVENDITKVQNAVTLTERPVILDVVLDKSVKKKSPLDEAPKVVTPFTVKKVRKTTVIEGKVTGRPTPDIKWLVNGQKVPQNDPKFKPTTKRDGTSTFEVPDEESEKGLEVTFIAENYLGKVDYSFVLSVDKPTTLDLNPIMEEFLLLCDPTISESMESAIVEPTDEKKPKEPSRKKPDEPSQKKPGQKPAEEDEEVDEESDQPQEKKQIESAPGLKKQPEEPAKKKPDEPKKAQPGKKPMDDEDEEVDEESDKPQEKKQIESAPSLRKKPDETKPIDYRTERVDDKPREVPQSGAVITSPIKPLVVDEDTVKFVVEFDGNNPKPSWTIDGKNVTLNKDAKIETKDNVSTLTLTNRKKYPKSELTFLVENDITKVQNAVTLTERPVILDVVLDKSVKKKSPLDEAPKVVTPFTVKKVRKTTVIEGKVTGRPTPDIKWLVNGQKVPQNDPKFKPTTKRDGTSTFEVPDEESEKGLEVTFIAENYLGKVDYSFVLSVDKPTTLDLNPIMEEFLLLCDPTISESMESAIVEPTDEKKPKEPSRKKPDEPSQKKPGQKPVEEDEEVDEESDQPQEKKQIESAPGLKKQPEEPAKKKPEEPKKTQPGKKPMDDEDEEVDEESDKPQEKKQIESAPSLRKKPDETKPIDYRTERVDDKPREVPQSGAVITSPIKPLVVDEDTVKFVVEFDGNNPKPSWTIDGKNVTLNKDAKIETKDNVSTLTLTNRKKYPKSELTFLVENDITKVQNAVTLTERPVILDVVLDKSVKKKSPLDEAPKVVTPFTVKKVRKTTVIEGKVTGRPTPDIKWLVNGQKVPQNDPKFKPTTKRDWTSTFEVPDEESEKGLEVTFIAENYLGKVDYSFVLSVDKPTTLDLNPIMEEFLLLCDPTISESMESAIVEPTDEKKPKEPSRKKPDEPSQKKPGQKPAEEDEEVDEESDQPQEKKQIESAPGLKKQPEEPAKKKPNEPKKAQPSKKPMDDEDEEVDEESDKPQEKKQIESAPSLAKNPDETKTDDKKTEKPLDVNFVKVPENGAKIIHPLEPKLLDGDTLEFSIEFDGKDPKPSWTIDGKNPRLNRDVKIDTKGNTSKLVLTNKNKYPKSEIVFTVENDISKSSCSFAVVQNRPVVSSNVIDKQTKKKSTLDEAPKPVVNFNTKRTRNTTVVEARIVGKPVPEFTWFESGAPIDPSDPKYPQVIKKDGTVSIEVPDSEIENGKEIKFIATNYLGSLDYSVVLAPEKPKTLDLDALMEALLLVADPKILQSLVSKKPEEEKPRDKKVEEPEEAVDEEAEPSGKDDVEAKQKPSDAKKKPEEPDDVDEDEDKPKESKDIETKPKPDKKLHSKKPVEEPEEEFEDEDKPKDAKDIETKPKAGKKPEESKPKDEPGKKKPQEALEKPEEEFDEDEDKPKEVKDIETKPKPGKKPEETKPLDKKPTAKKDEPEEFEEDEDKPKQAKDIETKPKPGKKPEDKPIDKKPTAKKDEPEEFEEEDKPKQAKDIETKPKPGKTPDQTKPAEEPKKPALGRKTPEEQVDEDADKPKESKGIESKPTLGKKTEEVKPTDPRKVGESARRPSVDPKTKASTDAEEPVKKNPKQEEASKTPGKPSWAAKRPSVPKPDDEQHKNQKFDSPTAVKLKPSKQTNEKFDSPTAVKLKPRAKDPKDPKEKDAGPTLKPFEKPGALRRGSKDVDAGDASGRRTSRDAAAPGEDPKHPKVDKDGKENTQPGARRGTTTQSKPNTEKFDSPGAVQLKPSKKQTAEKFDDPSSVKLKGFGKDKPAPGSKDRPDLEFGKRDSTDFDRNQKRPSFTGKPRLDQPKKGKPGESDEDFDEISDEDVGVQEVAEIESKPSLFKPKQSDELEEGKFPEPFAI